MKNILNLTLEQLQEDLLIQGLKTFVAKQIWTWLYRKGARDFNSMTDISKKTIVWLKENYIIYRPKVITHLVSADKTVKWLLELEDSNKIELVYIPEEDRGTLCISSQVGCPMGCKFCNTATQGLIRNLETFEIVSQFMLARDYLGEWNNLDKAIGYGRKITNIVMMGMGEPLLNYDNIVKTIQILNEKSGIAFSNRRITLSTCGIVDKIYDLAKDIKINLAISLHAPIDSLRQEIMPVAKKYSIKDLMLACQFYAKQTNYRRITFEYIMLDDINDKKEHAATLVNLVKTYKLPAKFNLIPFNPWKGCIFTKASSIKKINDFAKIINNAGYPCPVRLSRGQDIMAACGQLKSSHEDREN